MAQIAHRLETDGVSVDIVYGLDAIDRCLTRMELMAAVIETQPGPQRDAALHTLLSLLIAAAYQDRSIAHLARSNLQLLSRKIVDRSGKTGEHYIAWTRQEYWQIWGAAAGGGLVTTFTAAIKMVIVGAGLALFVEGLAAGLNYALSFLLLQAFGLVLATKQPAMTAAALANILRTQRGAERLDDLVDYAAQICRSQLAAAHRQRCGRVHRRFRIQLSLAADQRGAALPRSARGRARVRDPEPGGQRHRLVRRAHRRCPVGRQSGGRLVRQLGRLPPPARGDHRSIRSASASAASAW